MNVQEWLGNVNGRPVEADADYGPQCWDLWADYAMRVFGASMWAASTNSGGEYHNYGFVCEIWHNFGGSPLGQWFTPHTGTPQLGDVAIWEMGSAVAPLSHIAIVVADAGDSVYVMTQNPGNAHYEYITKSGILGYLRPDNQSLVGGGAPAPAATVGGSVSDLADAVLRGDFGNGPDRVAALGDRYNEVQAEVNRRLNGEPAPAPAPAPAPVEEIVVPTPEPVVVEPVVIDKVVENPVEEVKETIVSEPSAKEVAAIIKRQKAIYADAAGYAVTDLGSIITNGTARKVVWAIYGIVGLAILAVGGGMTAAQWIAPEWFIFATGSYTALGPAFASLAVANIKK